jgi:multimeric flavodoxin WrbA
MNLKVLGISTSPRANGSSDLLLRQALAGTESAGASTEYINLRDFNIAPCTECNDCYTTGKCNIEDDFQLILQKMLDADRLIFATPVFFMTVCAQAKLLIDRCQCLWVNKHILKKPLFTTERDRCAMVIAVGGSKSTKMFESIHLTMKYWLDVLEFNYVSDLFFNQIEEPSRIKQHPTALKDAYRLGRRLVAAEQDSKLVNQ